MHDDQTQRPTYVGPYRLLQQIGAGAMGAVFLAHLEGRDGRGQRFALKLILPHLVAEEEELARFRREAELIARLNHPYVVRLRDASFSGPAPYQVYELYEGGTLQDKLLREGAFAFACALELTRKLGEGLAHAHDRGVLHRDLKPQNVLLSEAGEPALSDFGLARRDQAQSRAGLTATGEAIGTPLYMAPEQAMDSKRVDARADLYGLAAICYALLSGQPPVQGASTVLEAFDKVINEPPPPLGRDDVPPAVEAVIFRALAKDPAERPGDVRAFLSALEEAQRLPLRTPSGARGGLAAALGLGVGLALGAGGVLAFAPREAGGALAASASASASPSASASESEASLAARTRALDEGQVQLAARERSLEERQAELKEALLSQEVRVSAEVQRRLDQVRAGALTPQDLKELYPLGSGGWFTLASPFETVSLLLRVVPFDQDQIALEILRVKRYSNELGLRDSHAPRDAEGQPTGALLESALIGERFARRSVDRPWVLLYREGVSEHLALYFEALGGSEGLAALGGLLQPTRDRLDREPPIPHRILGGATARFEPLLWAGPLSEMSPSRPEQSWDLTQEFRERVDPHRAIAGLLEPVWQQTLSRNALAPDTPWSPTYPLDLTYPPRHQGPPKPPQGILELRAGEVLCTIPWGCPLAQVQEEVPALVLSRTQIQGDPSTWYRLAWGGTEGWLRRAGKQELKSAAGKWGSTLDASLNLRARPYYPGKDYAAVLGPSPVLGVLPPYHPVLLTGRRSGPATYAPDLTERMRGRKWRESHYDKDRWHEIHFAGQRLWAAAYADYASRPSDRPTRRIELKSGVYYRRTWLQLDE